MRNYEVTSQAIDCINKQCSGRLLMKNGSVVVFHLIASVNDNEIVFVQRTKPDKLTVVTSAVSTLKQD
jgi:hypothetical protein